jgi:hypothetical protein
MQDDYEIVFVDRFRLNHIFPLSWIATVLYPNIYALPPLSLHVSLYHLYAGKCELYPNGPMSVYDTPHASYDRFMAPYAFGGKGKCQDRPVSRLYYQEQDRQTIRTVEFDFDNKKKVATGCNYKTSLEAFYRKMADIKDSPTTINLCPNHFKICSSLDVFPKCCEDRKQWELHTVAQYGDFAMVDLL